MSRAVALPTSLSSLLELAVNDAKKCEALPERYRLNMGEWVVRPKNQPEVCEVCMAGAVMTQSLGFEASIERLDPAKVGSDAVKSAMWAIDSMRTGEFRCALDDLDLRLDETPEQLAALIRCENLVEADRSADIDDEDDDGELKDRAEWSTYLQCAAILREVGL